MDRSMHRMVLISFFTRVCFREKAGICILPVYVSIYATGFCRYLLKKMQKADPPDHKEYLSGEFIHKHIKTPK